LPPQADDRQGPVALIKLPGLVGVKQIAHKILNNQSIQLLYVYQVVKDIGLGSETFRVSHILAYKTDGIDVVFPGHVGYAAPCQVKELKPRRV
jgi:hypothetical protein